MSHAVFRTGGKQYRVTEGDVLDVEKLDLDADAETTFDEVLMVSDGSAVKLGDPTVSGATVKAKVVDQFRDKKVIAFKFKRRKGYHRTIGHRRHLTRLEITSING